MFGLFQKLSRGAHPFVLLTLVPAFGWGQERSTPSTLPAAPAKQMSRAAAATYTTSKGHTTMAPLALTLSSACDIDGDGVVNVLDVQLAVNNYLSCSTTAFQTFYSQVVTGALSSCPVTTGIHTVAINWTASTTPGVTYNLYRATTSGGYNYAAPLNASPISATTFVDCTVTLGQTYYYVIRSVDSSGNQSINSTEINVSIPSN